MACDSVIARRMAVPSIRTDPFEVIDYLSCADSQLAFQGTIANLALIVHIYKAEFSTFDAESSEIGNSTDGEVAQLLMTNLVSRSGRHLFEDLRNGLADRHHFVGDVKQILNALIHAGDSQIRREGIGLKPSFISGT